MPTVSDDDEGVAVPTETKLEPFEGRDVATASVSAVTGIARALSEAMAAEPRIWTHGDKVHVVLECDVAGVDHARLEATDKLTRRHKLATSVATVVDPALVEQAIDLQLLANEQHALEVQREKEREQGTQRIPGTEPWPMPDDDEGESA